MCSTRVGFSVTRTPSGSLRSRSGDIRAEDRRANVQDSPFSIGLRKTWLTTLLAHCTPTSSWLRCDNVGLNCDRVRVGRTDRNSRESRQHVVRRFDLEEQRLKTVRFVRVDGAEGSDRYERSGLFRVSTFWPFDEDDVRDVATPQPARAGCQHPNALLCIL